MGISFLKFSFQYIIWFMVANNATEFATLNLMRYLRKYKISNTVFPFIYIS